MLGKIERHFEVAQRDDGLDAMFVHGIKHVVIEPESRFVGLSLIALGEDPAPGNGGAEALEAQFRKEGNIVLVSMIKVNALMIGIGLACQHAVSRISCRPVTRGMIRENTLFFTAPL